MLESNIPVVDLEDFYSDSYERKQKFIQSVGFALKNIGFFALEGHSIEELCLQGAFSEMQKLFDLNLLQKKKYEPQNLQGQRGYTSFGKEHAKDSLCPDLKEYWHIGQAQNNDLVSNIWPDELPDFEPIFTKLYLDFEKTAKAVLRAAALYIEEDESLFSDAVEGGNSILRLIHYPPVDQSLVSQGSVRAAAHEDINMITLLCGATQPGLELLQHDGSWLPIIAKPGQIIVDTGDMMQNITNGFFKSTTHRVVNPEGENSSRYSMPFFCHPRPEVKLDPLAACIARTGGQALFKNIDADHFLQQRLSEIGLNN